MRITSFSFTDYSAPLDQIKNYRMEGDIKLPERGGILLKIIAAEKQDTDRKLTISSSTSNNSFHIQNAHPVILKGKKSSKNRYHSLS